jgi:hypothetical protein
MILSALLVLGAPHPHLTLLFYTDPGSGMLIWQLATAGALGLLFYAKTIMRKLRVLIRSREPKETHEPPASNS